ncbi:hypothetical protein [Streptomyces sp. NPDC004629]|uniref:hypothetical protein n=1 Tax=Streptomyces sp. NPDC004629 TaxID=3364705 RepID=UPI00368E4E4B
MTQPRSRRGFLALAAATGTLASPPACTAHAAPEQPARPADAPVTGVWFGARLPNGLRQGVTVTAYGDGGRVSVRGTHVDFADCRDLTMFRPRVHCG